MMGQRGRWIEVFETVDGDYVDLPDEAGFQLDPECEWPDDMRVGWDEEDAACFGTR